MGEDNMTLGYLMGQESNKNSDGLFGGGDVGLVSQLYNVLSGKSEGTTTLAESVECHLMGIAAEESRKRGGKLVKVHK